jgi:hypothetical protein
VVVRGEGGGLGVVSIIMVDKGVGVSGCGHQR